jgi:hypothetical protein
MAANCAQLNNYFDNVLGITDAATVAALNNQGLASFEDFLTLRAVPIERSFVA